MIWIAAAGLMWLSCYGFYAVSSKHIAQTKQSKYACLATHPNFVRATAAGLLLLTMFLLRTLFSNSIGFVALWIFISPVLFIFILRINLLKISRLK